MTRAWFVWLAVGAVAMAACGSSDGDDGAVGADARPADAASGPDAGSTSADASPNSADASAPVADASSTAPDAGSASPDATAPTADAAAPVADSSVPLPDGATPLPDAAPPLPDAAVPLPDAAAALPDAAVPLPDATVPLPDAAPVPQVLSVFVAATAANAENVINAASESAVAVSLTTDLAVGAADSLEVTLSDGAGAFSTALASGTGSTTTIVTGLDASNLADGAVTIRARATVGGVAGPFADGTAATKDTVAPAVPGAPDLLAADDSGSSSSDNLTFVRRPRFVGTVEVGASVSLLVDNANVANGSADGAGAYQLAPSSDLPEGTRSVTVVAVDSAGNPSVPSTQLEVAIDVTSPAAPATPDLASASDSGPSSLDDYTNDNTPQIGGAGAVEAGAFVSLFLDGSLLAGVTANGAGDWAITTAALADKLYSVTAIATDAAGNASPPSAALLLTIDTVVAVPAAPDLDPVSDLGSSNTDNLTADTTPTFVGTVEPNATVSLTESGSGLGAGVANSGGAYAVISAPLGGGPHSVRVAQVDRAGNASGLSAALAIDIDTVPPAPVLASRSPAPGSGGVPAGVNIELAFTEAMNPASINPGSWYIAGQQGRGFLIERAPDSYVLVADPEGDGLLDNDDLLASGATISVVVESTLEDAAGNPIGAASGWSFSTRDRTPPVELSRNPAPLSAPLDAATWTTVTAQFNESMDSSRGRCSIERTEGDGSAASASVTGEVNGATLAWTTTAVTDDTLVMTFTTFVAVPGAAYHINCDELYDTDGNPHFGPGQAPSLFEAGFSYDVATANPSDLNPPDVVAVLPPAGATDVPPAPFITVMFSEPLDVRMLSDVRVSDARGDITDDFEFHYFFGGVILVARVALPPGDVVAVDVPTTLLDTGGNALAADRSFSFTVTNVADQAAPNLAESAPAPGETKVPRFMPTLGFALRDSSSGLPEFPLLVGSIQDRFLLVEDQTGIPVKGWLITGEVVDSEMRVRSTLDVPMPLLPGTVYRGLVGGFEDRAGNQMASDSFAFTTRSVDTDTAPYIADVYPRVEITRWSNGNATARWDTQVDGSDGPDPVTVTCSGPGGWSTSDGPHSASGGFQYSTATGSGPDDGNEPELAALPAGVYEVDVTAVDAANNTVRRTVEVFVFSSAPSAVSPLGGVTTASNTPTFTWTGIDPVNADALLLDVDNAAGDRIVGAILPATATSFTLAPEHALPASGNPYTWRIDELRFHNGVDSSNGASGLRTTPPAGSTSIFSVP